MQRLAEWFLGVPPSDPGQGMTPRLSHDFPWPAWVLVLFCVGAAAFFVVVTWLDAGRHRWTARAALVSLRCLTIAVLLVVLSEFQLTVERTGLPYLVVMVDVSGSTDREDQYPAASERAAVENLAKVAPAERPTRLNLAKTILTQNGGQLLKGWLGDHKLRLYTVAERESRLGAGDLLQSADVDALLPEIQRLQPSGDQTRLGDSVRHVLNEMRGTPPTAIVLFTDGVTTDGENLSSAARYARQKSVPLYIVGLGNAEAAKDLELLDVLADEVAFVDDPVTFVFKVNAQGISARRARVQLKAEGSQLPLATREIDLPADGHPGKQELTFTPREVGDFEYTLEIQPLENETDVSNNRATRKISVRKEKVRVLLVEDQPRWEFRELKNLLEREKSVDLKVVLQDSDPGFADEDKFALPGFPVKREELLAFDVILFGDVNPELLGTRSLENLSDFVREKGGGLAMIAGPKYNPRAYQGTPLEILLPVDLANVQVPDEAAAIVNDFKPELTIEGRKGFPLFRLSENETESQQIWSSLPGQHWFVGTPNLKASATVLAVHPLKSGPQGKLPIITFHRVGGGKVIFHAIEETWRWRFRAGDLYFGRYWVQLVRYLSRSKFLGQDRTAELAADRREYRTGDEVSLRVRFLDEKQAPAGDSDVAVIVRRQADGTEQRVKLTRIPEARMAFEGILPQVAEGSYHAWVAAPSFKESPPAYDFSVRSPARERRTPKADLAEINRAAELTRGKPYTPGTVHKLPEDIPPGFPVPLDADDPIRLWNHWAWIALFATLLGAEWMLRKRLKLV